MTADPRATLKDNKARPPTTKGDATGTAPKHGIVVVGGGAGALNVAESAREVRNLCNAMML